MAIVHRSIVTSLVLLAALVGPGCTTDAALPRAGAELDLSRFGVGEIAAEPDGAYRLLDALGQEIGRVDRTVDGDAVALSVAFAGYSAELAWSDGDASVACSADDTVLAACADGLSIAAELAEADGIDVPAFTPSDAEVDFRVACETISTWVFGESCSACFHEAESQAVSGASHDSGSCAKGAVWTSCSHKFCTGSEEQQ